MYKLKDEAEYRNATNRADILLEAEPEFESDEGMELGGLLDAIEDYEARSRPRLVGWLCAACNRSYSPDVQFCAPCNQKTMPVNAEQRNKQHYEDHLDHLITCDANFRGRGC